MIVVWQTLMIAICDPHLLTVSHLNISRLAHALHSKNAAPLHVLHYSPTLRGRNRWSAAHFMLLLKPKNADASLLLWIVPLMFSLETNARLFCLGKSQGVIFSRNQQQRMFWNRRQAIQDCWGKERWSALWDMFVLSSGPRRRRMRSVCDCG